MHRRNTTPTMRSSASITRVQTYATAMLGLRSRSIEGRNQLRHPSHSVPQLHATKPHERWSWDITNPARLANSQEAAR
jgi:hypothetical protein